MHPKLPARYHHHAVRQLRNVRRSFHPPAHDQTVLDALQRQASKALSAVLLRASRRRSWQAHVDDAVPQIRQRARSDGVRGARGQDDVCVVIAGNEDALVLREGRSTHRRKRAFASRSSALLSALFRRGFGVQETVCRGSCCITNLSESHILFNHWACGLVGRRNLFSGRVGHAARDVGCGGVAQVSLALCRDDLGGVVERDGGGVLARGLERELGSRSEGIPNILELFGERFDGLDG